MKSRLSHKIETFLDFTGRAFSWLNIVMVLVAFSIVMLRYFFHLGWVWLQDVVVYANALMFLGSAAYALQEDYHVRVDVFYQKLSLTRKALFNFLGTLFLLIPFCLLILIQSAPFVLNSWKTFEGAKDSGGLAGVFIFKSFILLYAIFLLLQSAPSLLKNWRAFRNG